MCLLWGIVDRNLNFDKDKVLDMTRTMEFYKGWVQSDPPKEFAFSDTLLSAFELLKEKNKNCTVTDVLNDAKKKNRRSTSSESLLRLLPLAIWTSTVKNPY